MQAPKEEEDDRRGSVDGGAGSPNVPGSAVGPGDQDSTKRKALPPREPPSALTVPFLTYVDAEVARRYLMAGAETYHGRVHWDLRVADSDLFIRLTAEDADLLQISTASLLHRLSIVVQTMQHFVPQFRPKCQSQKGN
ncbi:L antigen family member 3 [Myotis brandtii]|uniref:L antigen family member 3 n=1 Tax=Myotis brandtii TaxID=109478 RepID=S7NBP7_MYOBR|nr:L antigen family member 3 [Myotis brandtii]